MGSSTRVACQEARTSLQGGVLALRLGLYGVGSGFDVGLGKK
jgi:hypothetical protein